MTFTPYTAFDDLRFGMNRDAVIGFLGIPRHEEVNRIGDLELSWDSPALNARFRSGALTEVSVDVPEVSIGAKDVSFSKLTAFIREHDPAVFERVGFIVSPKYGLAFDPDFPDWVTFFSKERLSIWEQL